MKTINTTPADFDRATLLRGYTSAPAHGAVVYCRKISATTAHFIIDDRDGLSEFTAFNRNSAQRAAENTADTFSE